jgi:hypothetical protein
MISMRLSSNRFCSLAFILIRRISRTASRAQALPSALTPAKPFGMAQAWPIQFRDNEEIRLTKDGTWLSDGEEITHGETVRLFFRSVRKGEQGYAIHVGKESKTVVVEDTAFFVLGLEGSARNGYSLRLSDETREKLAPESLRYRPGRLTARVKGGEEAKFLSTAYFELLSRLEEDASSYFLTIEGKRVELSPKGTE